MVKAEQTVRVSVAVVLLVLMLSNVMFSVFAQDGAFSYKLLNATDGTYSYTLNVIVPQTLVDYYRGLSHKSASDADFSKFVTPYAVKPIADSLRQIYPNDEDFANGVLTIVHQIPYEETLPEYYPVETLSRNKGDCDMFSFLAASIMKAGGLSVVLLHYPAEQHMNLGVHFNEPPKDARFDVYSLKVGSLTYYVAEATSSNWHEGWRVGECPDDLKNASASTITLPDEEQVAPGQVSASFQKLEATTVGVSVSPMFTLEGGTITLQGQISPAVPNQNVTLYESTDGSEWATLGNAITQINGQFIYTWKSTSIGQLQIRASWTGNDQYAGTTSFATNTLILPFYLVALIALAAVAVLICVVLFLIKHNRRKVSPPMAISSEMPHTLTLRTGKHQ